MSFASMKSLALAACLGLTAGGAQEPSAAKPLLVLKAAHLWDGKKEQVLDQAVVIIEDDRIKAVGSKLPVPEGSTVIDLGEATLMPGLIDCHTHLLSELRPDAGPSMPGEEVGSIVLMSTAERALLGAARAKEMLEAGFTAVRDLGNSGTNGDVALRDAITKEWVQGPRIQASTRALSAIGGQFSRFAKEAQGLVNLEYVEVSTVDEARKAVRQAMADGADCIKVIVDSGGNTKVMGNQELNTIVEEAHRLKRKVAAHAVSDLGVDLAIASGVDSLEHGYLINDDQLKLMAKKGIWLVPTDMSQDTAPFFFSDPKAFQLAEPEMKKAMAGVAKRLKRAKELGVRVASGSDIYFRFPGMTRGQAAKNVYKAYIFSGLSPLDVLKAATSSAADLLGWSEQVGSLEGGRFADVIAVSGNPLQDIKAVEKVTFVMKGGVVVRK